MPIPVIHFNKFVKIWFIKPGKQHPLEHASEKPILHSSGCGLNEFRLRSHRLRFPNDKITLLSNFEDFDPKDQELLKDICKKYAVDLVGLNTLKQELLQDDTLVDRDVQLQLFDIALSEINSEDGSFGAASDILRTLSPVAKRGIYTDFDLIKKETPKYTQDAPWGFLVTASFQVTPFPGVFKLSNHFLACDETHTTFLQEYRSFLLNRYATGFNDIREYLNNTPVVHGIEETEQKFSFFDEEEIKKVHIFMENPTNKMPNLCEALQFRTALKKCATPENYKRYMEMLIQMISGPICMQDCLGLFLGNHFQSLAQKINWQDSGEELFQSPKSNFVYENQSDLSWLNRLNSDEVEQRFKQLEEIENDFYKKEKSSSEKPPLVAQYNFQKETPITNTKEDAYLKEKLGPSFLQKHGEIWTFGEDKKGRYATLVLPLSEDGKQWFLKRFNNCRFEGNSQNKNVTVIIPVDNIMVTQTHPIVAVQKSTKKKK